MPAFPFPLSDGPSSGSSHRFHYWSTGRILENEADFQVLEAGPSRNRAGRFDYRLFTPRIGLDPSGYQRAIERISSRVTISQLFSHPRLVPLVDAELDRPPFFWVEPAIDSPTLGQFLTGSAPPVSQVVWLIRQIGQLACLAHEHFRTLSGFAPQQIRIGEDGRISLGGLYDSHRFGRRLCPVNELPLESDSADDPGGVAILAGPDLDVRRIGRLILWMIGQTHTGESPRQPAVVALQILARRAVLASGSDGFAGIELTRRLLDQIMHVELDHLLNASPFGEFQS